MDTRTKIMLVELLVVAVVWLVPIGYWASYGIIDVLRSRKSPKDGVGHSKEHEDEWN